MPSSGRKKTMPARHAIEEKFQYQLGLEDDDVEKLARGEVSEVVALNCWEMLKWKREGARNNARELNGDE